MTHLKGEQQAEHIRGMFARIATRYELLNRLMTFGLDRSWRREAVRRLQLAPGARVLDVGAGTGDVAFEVRRQSPGARIVAADFTSAMLARGRERRSAQGIQWVLADALHLPFRKEIFDAAASAFLMRNVADLDAALAEQYRVLRQPSHGVSGGRLAILETAPPPPSPLQGLVQLYLHWVIPLLGWLISGDREAYRYLPSSTQEFSTPERLADRIRSAGFRRVRFVRRMFGTVAIYWGKKTAREAR